VASGKSQVARKKDLDSLSLREKFRVRVVFLAT
jgi:hypothetical protein